MLPRTLIPVLGGLVLTACSGPWYPPPPQRQFAYVEEPEPPGMFLLMGNPDAGDRILADISERIEGSGWRWTREHPRLSYRLPRTTGWKFRAQFGFPEANIKDTGPVTVSFLVNGHVLDKVRYTEPGDRIFEKAVPAAWLRAGQVTVAGADIEPPWIAPSDKARLGFVLHAAGFVE
ncbi:MAG TPA: hypothetical protein VHA11_09010 [Bryobacteraceae bacterium]|nr:hypothetical protein [Bryobacteraceae bacterium]